MVVWDFCPQCTTNHRFPFSENIRKINPGNLSLIIIKDGNTSILPQDVVGDQYDHSSSGTGIMVDVLPIHPRAIYTK